MRPYVTTFLLAALALLAGLAIGRSAFVLFIPFITAAFVYNAIAVIRSPERRRLRLVRSVVWLVVPAVVGAAHWYRFATTRAVADRTIAAIVTYRAQTGHWPTELAATGISEQLLQDRWMMGYLLTDGKPFFVYASPFEMFDTYTYNFDTHGWEYNFD